MAIRPRLVTQWGAFFNVDCLELFNELRAESIDTIFADPPFNIGKEYNNGLSDRLDENSYLAWSKSWLSQAVRVLKPGGAIFVYILPRWGYHFAAFLEESGMQFRHWIALTMKGTFPRGRKLYPAHYAILYFSKGAPKTFNKLRVPIQSCRHCGGDIKDYGGHRKYLNPLGINLTDFWEDTSPARHRRNKSRWHINELRPMIPARCLEMSTNVGEIVMDPFGGGGSTFVAAEQRERYWIGSEVGPAEPIIDRFEREFPGLSESTRLPEPFDEVFSTADARGRVHA